MATLSRAFISSPVVIRARGSLSQQSCNRHATDTSNFYRRFATRSTGLSTTVPSACSSSIGIPPSATTLRPYHPLFPVMTPPPKTLRAIFFDLDGTCLNSDSIHYETYRDTLLELVPSFNERQPISREFYDKEMSGKQNPQLVAHILPDLSEADQTALWEAKERRYEAVIARGVSPTSGLLPLLRFCQEHGVIHYIVTNAPRGPHAKTMDAIGITPFFTPEQIVLAEDCEHPKPHPAPYVKAMALAEVQPEHAIIFEDSPAGVTAAGKASVFTVGVTSTQTDEALRAAGASFTVSDFNDPVLLHLIEGWIGARPNGADE